jgi:hypothetical protein
LRFNCQTAEIIDDQLERQVAKTLILLDWGTEESANERNFFNGIKAQWIALSSFFQLIFLLAFNNNGV